jgi:hypothetical protein
MTTLYGAQSTYINNVKNLTAKEFGDKIDLFYINLSDAREIYSLNVLSNGNDEMTVDVTFAVEEDVDPQDFANGIIKDLVTRALHDASLNVKPMVDVRVQEPVGV